MADNSEIRNWLELPRELTAAIVSRVGAIDMLESVQYVCPLWRDICKDPSMWRSIDFRNDREFLRWSDLNKMCMHAVDRSKGDLIDINIEHFGTNELLAYITQSSRHLRRLRLVSCNDISDEGLCRAASKLNLLEALEISYCSFSPAALGEVGLCCPNLKSFKYNEYGFTSTGSHCDKAAQAIAENMHELRYLQLFGNKLSNCGLQAILDGCPRLESLDLRHCFNVSLQGDLEKKCIEQIKHLWRPHDSTQDYDFYANYHCFFDSYQFQDAFGLSDLDLMPDGDYDMDLMPAGNYDNELHDHDLKSGLSDEDGSSGLSDMDSVFARDYNAELDQFADGCDHPHFNYYDDFIL